MFITEMVGSQDAQRDLQGTPVAYRSSVGVNSRLPAESRPGEGPWVWQRAGSRWKKRASAAIQCFTDDPDAPLIHMGVLDKDCRKTRTTNTIGRSYIQVRRRIKSVTVFSDANSAERIIVSVLNEVSSRWKDYQRPKKTNLTQSY
jgi:transposase-like protein